MTHPHPARHRRPRSRARETNAVSVHLHGKGPQGAKPTGEAVADILAAIRERRS